jgi:hypothetical protein
MEGMDNSFNNKKEAVEGNILIQTKIRHNHIQIGLTNKMHKLMLVNPRILKK